MIVAAYLSLLIFGFLDNFRGPFFSQILSDFQVNESTGAALFGVTSIFASLSSAFSGRMIVWTGVKRLNNLSSIMMGLGFIIMGASTQFFVLLVGASVLGLGLGLAALVQNISAAEFSHPDRRSQVMSGLQSMYALSSSLAPFVASLLMLAAMTWRQSFMIFGLIPILFAFGNGIWGPNKKLQSQLSDKLSYLENGQTKNNNSSSSLKLISREKWHIFIFALGSASYLWAEISVGTRLVRWQEVVHQKSAALASVELTYFFIALLGGRLLAWIKSPKTELGLRRVLLGNCFFGALFLIIALWFKPQWMWLAGLSIGSFYPLSMAYARERFQEKTVVAYTWILAIGSAGVVTLHFVLGAVTDHLGLQWAMQIGPIGLLLTFTILLIESRLRFRIH